MVSSFCFFFRYSVCFFFVLCWPKLFLAKNLWKFSNREQKKKYDNCEWKQTNCFGKKNVTKMHNFSVFFVCFSTGVFLPLSPRFPHTIAFSFLQFIECVRFWTTRSSWTLRCHIPSLYREKIRHKTKKKPGVIPRIFEILFLILFFLTFFCYHFLLETTQRRYHKCLILLCYLITGSRILSDNAKSPSRLVSFHFF